jgi:hypothetical protein
MSKRLWILFLAVAAGSFFFACGGGPSSDEELRVKAVGDGFTAAASDFVKASRAMGGLGMDTTADAEGAVVEIKKIRAELADLTKTLTEEEAIRMAGELKARIDDFCRKNDIE